jgi:hypothetical protein
MRARLVPVLLTLCLGVGACTDGGEEPDAAPTLSPITESPSPSPEPDAVPPQATEATPEGAAEFVRFFYKSLERAYANADPEVIESLSADGCESCQNFVESIADLRDQGGRVEAFTIDVVDVQAAGVEPAATTAAAVVVLDVSEYVRVERDGSESAREPAVSGAVNDVQLVRVEGEWLVQGITQ